MKISQLELNMCEAPLVDYFGNDAAAENYNVSVAKAAKDIYYVWFGTFKTQLEN